MGIKLSDMKDVKFEEKKSEINEEKYENLNKKYEELKDCSKDELLGKLYSEVAKQKQEGKFDIESLRDNIEKIKSFMPLETYENMLRILETLK